MLKLAERIRRRLQVLATRDWQLLPTGRHRGGEAAHLLVLVARPYPTVDYYLHEALEARAGQSRVVFDAQVERFLGPNPEQVIKPDTRVVLVRTPSSRWLEVLKAAERELVEVVWLIDDDVVAARDDPSLPEEFRLRLLGNYLRFKRTFAPHIDKVWASTAQIAARFPTERVELRPPSLFGQPRPERRSVTIFYHGTSAHRREHDFLLPIFEQVQARLQHTLIEITGDHALYRKFRGIPRLRVLHPMPWPDYLAHVRSGNYDLGLAPLLDSPFNRGRSGLKALQIAELGAQGVLSRRPPYTDYAHLPGMHLVGDEPAAWVELITSLAQKLGEPGRE